MRKYKSIPFTDKEYLVYRTGEIYSVISNRVINGKHISRTNPRLMIDARVNGIRKSLLINRLVYFLFKYNKKPNATFKDFLDMPLVVHMDGKTTNNRLENLSLFQDKHELGKWTNGRYPRRLPLKLSPIQGEKAELVLRELKKGTSYAEIGRIIEVSDMSIFRFAKRNNIKSPRASGAPKLTIKKIKYILKHIDKYPQKYFAKKYNCSETCISRLVNGKTYKSII